MNSRFAHPPEIGGVPPLHGRETILVVDDHPPLCKVAEILLKRCGYRVLIALDASQAKEIVRRNPEIDLLLTDIEMPDLPGDQLAEWFLAARPCAAVVFMSGNPLQEHQLAGYGYPFIEKPFVHLDTLVAAVREALRHTHEAQQGSPVAA